MRHLIEYPVMAAACSDASAGVHARVIDVGEEPPTTGADGALPGLPRVHACHGVAVRANT
jgi:hypothetical protein